MKGNAWNKTSIEAARIVGRIIVFLMLGLPLPAIASLGAYEGSVQNDQVSMRARVRTNNTGAYTIHELKSPLGTVVREYVSPGGRVFAVSWQGPFLPDMKQILGRYFGQYSVAAKEQR